MSAETTDAEIPAADGGKPLPISPGPGVLAGLMMKAARPSSARSRIARENEKPGTSSWQLVKPALHHEVEGYASLTSAAVNEVVRLRINVERPKAVHWELYRMGYYQGLHARFIASAPPRTIEVQPECSADRRGLVECQWADAFEVTIDPSWVTGQYFFKLIADDGSDSYVPLVVREPTHRAQVIFQSSVATWQAYNVFGGSSLYHNALPASVGFGAPRAYAVSFNRPYGCDGTDNTCLPGMGDFDLGEHWLARWLEQRGVDVAYVTTLDVDADADLLTGRKLFLSVGHDEYWPLGVRNHLEAARDAGVSLGFFSGNTGYWRVRVEASTQGEPRRTIVCYKDARKDPVQNAVDVTVMYRSEPFARPENALLGVMYDVHGSRTYYDGFPQIVRAADHWIYEGTGVRNGDVLGHAIGYEWDNADVDDDSQLPKGLTRVAHAELFNVRGAAIPADIGVYSPTPTSVVVAVGSIYWSRALSEADYLDLRIERMTENVLLRAGVTPFAPLVVDMHTMPSDSGVRTIAGAGTEGSLDGPAMIAQFVAPAGIAAGAHGEFYITDVATHTIRVVAANGAVSTLAGCGAHRYRDGDGVAACFDQPTSIVRAADGTLYVADTNSQHIRAVTPEGHVSTFAGTGQHGSRDAADPLQATFDDPRGLALGSDGALYVAESGSGRVRKIDASGVSTVPGTFAQPTGLAVGPDDTLYVVDTRSGTIKQWKSGVVTTLAGADSQFGAIDGPASSARLRPGEGIALDGARLVFSDSANHRLRVLDLHDATVSTLAGQDGTTGGLELPRSVVATAQGFVVADSGHHRIALVPRQP